MLVQLNVKNFRSIRDEAVLSMLASKDNEHTECLITVDENKSLLPVAAIYGANAAGKSNIVLALQLMQKMVAGEYAQPLKDKELPFEPYAFDEAIQKQPTEFGVIFYYDGIKYEYSISYDRKRIISESLYHWPNGREALIFARDNGKFEFRENKSEQQTLAARTPDNRLYLVSSNSWNLPQTEKAFKWFNEKLVADDFEMSPTATVDLMKAMENPLRKKIIEELLHADLGIVDVGVTQLDESKSPTVLMVHKTKHDSKQYPLSLDFESIGTQRFFARIGPWLEAMESGGVLILDELEASMHPLLTRHLVEMIQNPEINANKAQIIFTTHDALLLDLSLLRRDQIWFAEKNPDTLSTEIYSLWDYSARKDENVQKGYLQGRYGAIPFIGGES